MGTLIKYMFIGTTLYMGINWVADNPAKFNHIRKQMNGMVATGIEEASNFIKEIMQ